MALQTFTAGQVLTAAQVNALQANDYNQTVSTKTDSYVLVAADKGTRIAMNKATATTITVNTSLFSAGDTLFIQNIGAGVCTITAGTATVSTAGSLALAQNAGGTLYFTSAGVSIFFPTVATAPTSASGLTLIASQTIGTAVSSVTVSNCFSATYDSYQVFINDSSASTTDYISLRLGVSGTPATGASYDSGFVQTAYSGSAVTGAGSASATKVEYAGRCTSFFVELDCRIIDPFTIKHTRFHSQFTNGSTGAIHQVGLHRETTSYNDLVVLSNGATMTGGKIRVYGYQNS